jgi:hypothetical protein
VDKYITGQYEPKANNSVTQDIGLAQLMVGKYKKVEVTNTSQFMARSTPMRIEHALLQPRVQPNKSVYYIQRIEPREYIKLVGHIWSAESIRVWYGTCECREQEPLHQCSTRVFKYWIGVHQIVLYDTSPTQILSEPTKKDKYCIYVAFEGKVPWNDDEQFDCVCPMDQVFYTATEKACKCKKSQDICKSVCTPKEEWLLDTGATVHITPNKHLLVNTSICCREIKVANSRYVRARQVQDILLKSECGNYLYLQGILYSLTFNKNIISAPQLMQSQDCTITMKNNYVQMQYMGTGLKMKLKTTDNLCIYIYCPATAGTCIKIPGAKNYKQ